MKKLRIADHKLIELYSERLNCREERLGIVEKMSKINAPVEDWEEAEKKILRSRSI